MCFKKKLLRDKGFGLGKEKNVFSHWINTVFEKNIERQALGRKKKHKGIGMGNKQYIGNIL